MWWPIAAWGFYFSFVSLNFSIIQIVLSGLAGLLTWTLMEYWLHRKFFHWQPKIKFGDQFHFIIHGVHHKWPNDAWRLVMPPAASLLLSIPFGVFFYALLGAWFFSFFAGILIGYTWYEMTHYAVHHLKFKKAWFKKLKRHHLQHHFSEKHADCKFGVSTPLWDIVFKTY